MDLLDELRRACAEVGRQARFVVVDDDVLRSYAAALELPASVEIEADAHYLPDDRELRARFFLTLAAVNFGSGWWPTIRKRPGLSGYYTVATALTEHFAATVHGWSAAELAALSPREVAAVLGQDPEHELMDLYARSLRDVGARVERVYGGRFAAVVDAAGRSAARFVELLAGWDAFADVSSYGLLRVPFCKRAQLAASDLAYAAVAEFVDLERLTLFADNVVPHVLRVDGVLRYASELAARVDAGELIAHGFPEEVEIRACAVWAVERIAALTGASARELDYVLWQRGHEARYKSRLSHRARCTAY